MTLEEKKIVYKDLCGRLPYNVKILRHWIAPMSGSEEENITRFDSNDVEILSSSIEMEEDDGYIICEDGSYRKVRQYSCKPYLRPLSSMTAEEKQEWSYLYLPIPHENIATETQREIDWLNEHHFDYRGLIEKGLALEASVDVYEKI